MEPKQSNPKLEKYRQESNEILKKRGKMVRDKPAKPKVPEDPVSEEEDQFEMPKKAEFRMRAHCNPLCDTPFPL